MKYCLTLLLTLFVLSGQLHANPPYHGTIFIDPDVITPSDPSTFQRATYVGQGQVRVYDRRVDNWITMNAYRFAITWSDGLTSEAQVNPEFGSVEAARVEAEKYGWLIGQLPFVLRTSIQKIWIHQGVQPFGGGNHSILIHTGQTTLYEKDGILEETLVHESCHTSLDHAHSASNGWLDAQKEDAGFISTYAKAHPAREDVAESFLPWLMVRFREHTLSKTDFDRITQAIPHRLAYFSSMEFNLYPFVQADRNQEKPTTSNGCLGSCRLNAKCFIIQMNGVDYPLDHGPGASHTMFRPT